MSGELLPRRPGHVTRQTAAGIVVALLQLLVFWHVVHSLRDAIHVHPAFILLFPFVGVLFLASFLPMVVFLSLENDFYGLNPIHPMHFGKITWLTYKALVSNNWKIASKDM